MYETLQNSPSVIVWCALSKKEIIRPYFLEDGNVTGSRYKRMPRYFLLPKFRDYPETMILQQDGAPRHYANEVEDIFGQKASLTNFGKRWTDFMACALPRLDIL